MGKDHACPEDESQARFERYIFSLTEKGELYIPKGVIYPEQGLITTLPPPPSLAERLIRSTYRVKGLLLQPALAYVLVLGLSYPAYLGLWQKPKVITQVVKEKELIEVPKPVAGIGTTRDFSLGAGVRRDRPAEKEIVLTEADGFFTLSFFVPITREPDVRYDLEIKAEEGSVVATQKAIASRDGLGNFSLACSRSLFQDGHYTLRVLKINRAGAVEEEFPFKFKLVRSSG